MNWSYREPTLDEDLVRLNYQSLDGGRWDRPARTRGGAERGGPGAGPGERACSREFS
jgi:hypothetical protein